MGWGHASSPFAFQCIELGALVPPLTQILATAVHFVVIVSSALVFRLVKLHCSECL